LERLSQRARSANGRSRRQNFPLSGVPSSRHGDDLRLCIACAERLDNAETISLWHEDVNEHEIGPLLALQPESGLPVARVEHVVAGCLEDDAERAPKHVVIIHHQDSCHLFYTLGDRNENPCCVRVTNYDILC